MGLRFRKSVTICKGVKLNFGKTGMSVTLGTKGYHKTIGSNGRVTTSVGIPGTGIYYTDTKNIGNGNRRNTQNHREEPGRSGTIPRMLSQSTKQDSMDDRYDDLVGMQSIFDTSDAPEEIEIPKPVRSVDCPDHEESSMQTQKMFSEIIDIPKTSSERDYENEANYIQKSQEITLEDINRIFRYCDPTIEWTEILSGATAEELLMDVDVWNYCKTIAPKILQGNIDSYLQAIEELRPVDDLLAYSGDFEFGTDMPSYIEVEFTYKADELLPGSRNNEKFQKLIEAVSVRIARDLMALLPVSKVIVHVVDQDITVMSGIYDRATINKYINLNLDIDTFIEKFEYRINCVGEEYTEVERFRIIS